MYTENRTGASAYPAVRRRLQNLFYTTALFQTRYGQESALWEPVDTVLFFSVLLSHFLLIIRMRVWLGRTPFFRV